MTLAAITLNRAGYVLGIQPGPSPTGEYTVAWYPASGGPQRASVFATSPGYVISATASSFSNAQSFLLELLRGTPTSGFTKRTPTQTAVTNFGAALTAYQSAVRDVSGSGVQWIAPFPQTVATRWRDLLTAYAVAWTTARDLATQLVNSQGSPNTYVPSNNIQNQTVNPKLAAPVHIATLPPEVQAQITGTRVSPTTAQGAPSGTSPAAASQQQAQYAAQASSAAGAPLELGTPGYTPTPAPGGTLDEYVDPTRHVISTPLYKMPSFWIAVGGVLALVGVTGYLVQKRKRGARA